MVVMSDDFEERIWKMKYMQCKYRLLNIYHKEILCIYCTC